MQFTKLNGLLALLALPILAAATPWATPTTSVPITTTVTVTSTATSTAVPASSCDTGDLQCCDSTESSSSASGAALLGLVGVAVDGLDVLLGVTCSPITVVGGVAGSCSASPVCCENNNFNGVVAIGCVPVTL